MAHIVYRIQVFDVQSNKYSVGREESWTLKQDKVFDNEQEAREYVLDKNRIHSDMVRLGAHLIMQKNDAELQKYYEDFCFNDDRYLRHRRYFLGKPSANKIREQLRQNGIRVLSH
jgi:hypothetical protein